MGVSKTNERLKLGFDVNILNLFNQRSPIYIQQNLLRTGSISPTNGGGIDYQQLETGGYNYIDVSNTPGNAHRYLAACMACHTAGRTRAAFA